MEIKWTFLSDPDSHIFDCDACDCCSKDNSCYSTEAEEQTGMDCNIDKGFFVVEVINGD